MFTLLHVMITVEFLKPKRRSFTREIVQRRICRSRYELVTTFLKQKYVFEIKIGFRELVFK